MILMNALFFGFVVCCVASAALQIVAWTRHARPGASVSFRALRNPEPYLTETGRRLMQLALRLLNTGALAYLAFGVLNLVAR